MKRFLTNIVAQFKKSRRRIQARRDFRSTLQVECLEERRVMSTLEVVPAGSILGPNQFASFQDAYAAARAGDTIFIDNGVKVTSAAAGLVGQRWGGGAAGQNWMTIDNNAIGLNDVVAAGTQKLLITGVTHTGGSLETVYFDQPLQANASSIQTQGYLGIEKQLTINGTPFYHNGKPVGEFATRIMVLGQTSGLVFRGLVFSGGQQSDSGIWLTDRSSSTTIAISTIEGGILDDSLGAGGDTIEKNLITGLVTLEGRHQTTNVRAVDYVHANTFQGYGWLWLNCVNAANVDSNTFTLFRGFRGSAIRVSDVNNYALITNNTIRYQTGYSDNVAIFVEATHNVNLPGVKGNTWVEVSGNSIATGYGTGLLLEKAYADCNLTAMVEFNDFNANAEGVSIFGDGTSAGTIDLGGGSPGSQGQNNFSQFTAAQAGHFAIALHGTAWNYYVPAYNNSWSSNFPEDMIKDGQNSTYQQEAVSRSADGSGFVVTS